MTPPDDLLKRAKAALSPTFGDARMYALRLLPELIAALESDRAEGREAGVREALDALKGRGEYLLESKLRDQLAKKPEVGT